MDFALFEAVVISVSLDEEERGCEALRVIMGNDDRWDSGVACGYKVVMSEPLTYNHPGNERVDRIGSSTILGTRISSRGHSRVVCPSKYSAF